MQSLIRFFLFILVLLPQFILAQDLSPEPPSSNSTLGKWEFSYAIGFSSRGSKRDIRRHMADAKFGPHVIETPLGPITYYRPDTKNQLVHHYSLTYNFSQRNALRMSFGLNQSYTLSGRRIEPPAELTLKVKSKNLSATYVYNLDDRNSFSVGPSLIFHAIEQTSLSEPVKNKVVKPGINLGYSFNLINGKNFFIKLEPSYSLGQKMETGSFFERPYVETEPLTNEVLLESTEANTSTFNFKVSVGFKLGGV